VAVKCVKRLSRAIAPAGDDVWDAVAIHIADCDANTASEVLWMSKKLSMA
jgi:hypothetical protein